MTKPTTRLHILPPAKSSTNDVPRFLQDIDAYWLQRRIAAALDLAEAEAEKSKAMAEGVLEKLGSDADQRTVENELVLSLGFEQFELIKEIINNRVRIVWCTKLGRCVCCERRRSCSLIGGHVAFSVRPAKLNCAHTWSSTLRSRRSIWEEPRNSALGVELGHVVLGGPI